MSLAYVRTTSEPDLPPPLLTSGPLAWMRANLFSSPANTAVTLALAALALWLLPPLIAWATVNAVWSAPDGGLCRAHQDGACWAFIARKLGYLLYGSYPEAQRWRVDLDGNRRRRADRLAAVARRAAPRFGLGAVLRRSIRSSRSSCCRARRRSGCPMSTRCCGAACSSRC